ncbi:MAG: class IV adenylate cyclase [Halodesulfurarchaeum sp.]|nr:class IV adenylate cyclase [Halodesulfurarchaeum sp.]
MYEVEVKVRADHDLVRSNLEAAGATALGTIEQVDVYFDAPHRDFAARDEALRLREQTDSDGSTTVLTHKGPRLEGATKTRTEHETEVGSRDEMQAALTALGFSPAATVEKTRDRYAFEDCTVTLDRVAGLGEFVEVEAIVTEDAIERAQDRVTETLENLELGDAERLQTSYLDLLAAD